MERSDITYMNAYTHKCIHTHRHRQMISLTFFPSLLWTAHHKVCSSLCQVYPWAPLQHCCWALGTSSMCFLLNNMSEYQEGWVIMLSVGMLTLQLHMPPSYNFMFFERLIQALHYCQCLPKYSLPIILLVFKGPLSTGISCFISKLMINDRLLKV